MSLAHQYDDVSFMTQLETNNLSLTEDLTQLRLLLPTIIKGLHRRPTSLPAALEATLRTGPFSRRHFLVLIHLAESDGLSVSELSERLSVTLPTVSVVIHQLAAHGLVQLREDAADRRRTIVCIDPQHRQWVEAALAELSAPLRRTLCQLEPAERAGFMKAMRILAAEVAPDNLEPSPDYATVSEAPDGRSHS